MDEFLKCPWCGDEIAVADTRNGNLFNCPSCAKGIDLSKVEMIRPATPPRPWKSKLKDGSAVIHIGSCSGTTEASAHVEALLAAHGIWALTEGSKADTIAVPEADAGRAKELLRRDPSKERFHVTIYPD